MKKIWAPWRMEYITQDKSGECIFCSLPKSENDKKIRTLNKQYRGQDRATDVLSFSQNEDEGESKLNSHLMGDVVISTETAKRQAAEHGLTLEEEIVLLLIHGILHLLGFDHERSDEESCHMKQKTRELFDWIFPNKKPEESCNLYSD